MSNDRKAWFFAQPFDNQCQIVQEEFKHFALLLGPVDAMRHLLGVWGISEGTFRHRLAGSPVWAAKLTMAIRERCIEDQCRRQSDLRGLTRI